MIASWFWDNYYIKFLYRPSKEHTCYYAGFVTLKAKNKRHARKVFFKFLPSKYKRGTCRIVIRDFTYLPDVSIAEDYDGPNHFWENQLNIG